MQNPWSCLPRSGLQFRSGSIDNSCRIIAFDRNQISEHTTTLYIGGNVIGVTTSDIQDGFGGSERPYSGFERFWHQFLQKSFVRTFSLVRTIYRRIEQLICCAEHFRSKRRQSRSVYPRKLFLFVLLKKQKTCSFQALLLE